LSLARRRLTLRGFVDAFTDTLFGSGMIFTILIGALVFNRFLAVSTIPMEMANLVTDLQLSPIVTIMIIIFSYLVLGCFIDAFSMVLLTVPIFVPVVSSLGFDPVWFGIVTVLVVEMALITPPVGMNVYVISGIAEDVPIDIIFKGVMPYLFGMIILIILLTMFPGLALFLTR
jgi:TRAP-type C4-dicarboxylate transport system permease large subunit